MLTVKLLLLATVWTYWNHEPADHLRRMGSGPSVFTIGEWLPQWYERLHGDELIAKASGLGVDAVYCHFFKGFGLKHEHAEMQRTKDFTRKAHAHGVKVLGYCQFNSLYYEAMLAEIPNLETWAARSPDGGIVLYSGNKINIDYFVYDIMDRDDVADICDFLADQEKDDIEAAIREFGQDFSENEIRLVRIKFISDMAN